MLANDPSSPSANIVHHVNPGKPLVYAVVTTDVFQMETNSTIASFPRSGNIAVATRPILC